MNYLMRLASRAAQGQAAVFDASGASSAAAPRPSLRSESPLVRADQRLHMPELAAVAAVGQTDFPDVEAGEDALAMESASLQQIAAPAGERAPNAAPETTVASGAASIAPSVSPPLGATDGARLDVDPPDDLERVVERRVEVLGRSPSIEVAPLAPADRIPPGLTSLLATSPPETSDGALHEVAAMPVAEQSMPPALARALEAAQAWLSQGNDGDERFHVSEAKPQPPGAPRFADERPFADGAADEARTLGLSIGQIHVEVVSTPAPLANAQKSNAARPARVARAPARPPSWGMRQPFGWRQR